MTQPYPKPAQTDEQAKTQRSKKSRSKGRKAESEVAHILGGERVPLSGMLGGKLSGDVTDSEGRIYEVKIRKSGFKMLYRYLQLLCGYGVTTIKRTLGVERGRTKPPFALIVRQDNSPWLTLLLLEDYCHLLDRLANAEARAEEGQR